MTFSPTDLDNLERPVARVRVGKSRKGAPTERTVQRSIIKAAGKLGIWCCHIPNGSHLAGDSHARMRQTVALKADGMRPGMPDLLCFMRGGRVGLLEVKRPGGYLSPQQMACIARIDQFGVPTGAASSVDEAIETWKQWRWI